jgi:hypothetical protein
MTEPPTVYPSEPGTLRRRLLCALLVLLLLGISFGFEQRINRQRAELGMTRGAELQNAPPMLAFTTVALGGFRGLIVNALWVRANDLQNDGKYFENVQLADWITKLQPTFTQVWIVQAWNMAYNISVKFTDYADRWRWVQRGIELLRDNGLQFNPKDALMYRELAWFYQHKIGQTLDDAHNYYKAEWAKEMTALFGGPRPNFEELLNPQTEAARNRVQLLRQKYKMDPALMKEVDDRYGPLEWRLPEAHAIYWATRGLKVSQKKDLLTLRRVIYQSMHIVAIRGHIVYVDPNGRLTLGPDLNQVPRASAAYEQMMAEDEETRDAMKQAYKNFLREVVFLFYANNRNKDAEKWMKELRQKFPTAVPANQSVEEYALDRIKNDLPSLGHDVIAAVLDGMLIQYYFHIAVDDDERADGLEKLALQVWKYYAEISKRRPDALQMPPFEQMKKTKLDELLDTNSGFVPEIRERLRKKLRLPEPAPAPAPKL